MPSPFPGMDPYLESQPFWGDLHSSMIAVMKGELNRRLPENYTAWSDIYIWLHEPDAETRKGKPDVFFATASKAKKPRSVATLPAPSTTILPAVRREGNRYLKIKEVRSERVVTVIELLSPTNKEPGEDRDAFQAKRNEYLANRTNIVEIDLLRAGLRLPLGEPPPERSDYYALVCRAVDFPKTALWTFSVRQPLPEIAVPLNPVDGYVSLPLQKCFTAAYELGSYPKAVDYRRPPRVSLSDADAEWARQLLDARSSRPRRGSRMN
jgi:hypothetical protein